jgi:cytochrome P450
MPRLKGLTPMLERICIELVDAWPDHGRVEFVSSFSSMLPMRAIALVLDLPGEDPGEQISRFARWRDAAVASIGAQVSDDQRLAAERGVVEMQSYLHSRLERAKPGDDDVFAALRYSEIEEDGARRTLTEDEMLTILQQLFIGGIETTDKLLAETMIMLEGRDDVWERVRRDPRYLRLVCEEALRLASPAQGIFRRPVRNVQFEGVTIPAESRLVASFSAANRDPSVYIDPDTFDPERPALGRHLAFGRGTHFCLGAALARLEIVTALAVLSECLTRYRIVSQDVPYARSWMLRGPTSLELELEKNRAGAR